MNKHSKINALGFIEVIIAIVVVGITSAVFLTMSGRAMRELVQTERLETMKRVARDGVQISQEVANKEKNALPGEEFFPVDADNYSCFIPMYDEAEGYQFLKGPDDNFLTVPLYDLIFKLDTSEIATQDAEQATQETQEPTFGSEEPENIQEFEKIDLTTQARNWAIDNAVYDLNNNQQTDDDYFLLMCITDIDNSGTKWANVFFWVGDIHVKGQRTSDTDMKDFKYYAIIDL